MTMQSICASLTLAAFALASSAPAQDEDTRARSVILFIGDGMGLAQVAAASYAAGGQGNSAGLFFESFPVTGYVTTHSADSFVTDSAAAATSMASGIKTANGALGVDVSGEPAVTILEQAEERGLATGLVTSVPIGHATPAAFYAHVSERGSVDAIIDAALSDPKIEVLLGGGLAVDELSSDEVFASAEAAAYTVLRPGDGALLAEVSPGLRVFGIFDENGNRRLDYVAEHVSFESTEPRLVDLATAAVRSLSASEPGFFLMVEGGAIDWASHDNEIGNTVDEVREFDAAIEAVCALLDGLGQLDETLIIVTADHETGGLTLPGPYRRTLTTGEIPSAEWSTGGHSGIPVGLWARGPHAEACAGRLDQTEIHGIMCRALGL